MSKFKAYTRKRRAWLNPIKSYNTGWYMTQVSSQLSKYDDPNKLYHHATADLTLADCTRTVTLDFSERQGYDFKKIDKLIAALQQMRLDMVNAQKKMDEQRAKRKGKKNG